MVLSTPGSILTDWRALVPAILYNGMPGEQVGPALGDILFGAVSPQAKLPVTMPSKDNEQGFSVSQYPGTPCVGEHCTLPNGMTIALTATYAEGQIVGYRWYDKHKVAPAFAFGHGLSYGSFAFSSLAVSGRTVSFTVRAAARAPQGSQSTYMFLRRQPAFVLRWGRGAA